MFGFAVACVLAGWIVVDCGLRLPLVWGWYSIRFCIWWRFCLCRFGFLICACGFGGTSVFCGLGVDLSFVLGIG